PAPGRDRGNPLRPRHPRCPDARSGGFELAAAIRGDAQLGRTRLLILTSAGQRGDGERCRQLGIQAYLTKPIARADLIEAVGTVLAETPSAGGGADRVTRPSIAQSRPS